MQEFVEPSIQFRTVVSPFIQESLLTDIRTQAVQDPNELIDKDPIDFYNRLRYWATWGSEIQTELVTNTGEILTSISRIALRDFPNPKVDTIEVTASVVTKQRFLDTLRRRKTPPREFAHFTVGPSGSSDS